MSEAEHGQPAVPPAEDAPAAPLPANDKFRDLAELEEQIRKRLRSNQRFLEKFLDEDFIDDETGEDDAEGQTDEEEL